MSATIQILSGLGGKGPAAIVVEAHGKRLGTVGKLIGWT